MVDTATDDRDHGSLPVPRYSSDDEREPLSRLDVAPEQPDSIQRRLLSLPEEEFGFLPRELTLVVDASPGGSGSRSRTVGTGGKYTDTPLVTVPDRSSQDAAG